MNPVQTDLTGLVLAGGGSRRMEQDKALLPYKDTTLLAHSVEKLGQLCPTVCIASSNPAHKLSHVTLVPDEFSGQGPLSGVISGMKMSTAGQLLVLPCDTPLVPLTALQMLLEVDAEIPSAIVFREGEQIHPLIGSFPKTLLPEMEAAFARGERSMVRLLSKIPVVFIEANANLSWYQPGVFQNINTPGDYQILLES